MEPITIERDEHGFTVRQGDKYSGHLCFDEMLGLIVALSLPDDFRYHRECWMLTEEQHRERFPWMFHDKEEKPKEILLLTMK